MTKQNEIYKCPLCGIMVAVTKAGGGTLMCCGKPMELLKENTEEAATEKHVPVIERTEGGIKVKVGEVSHPMEAEHLIEWIEVLAAGVSYKKFLQIGEAPAVEFPVTGEDLVVRAYCNLHGLWKNP